MLRHFSLGKTKEPKTRNAAMAAVSWISNAHRLHAAFFGIFFLEMSSVLRHIHFTNDNSSK